MGKKNQNGPSGVLVIDKPAGCTSHDVVARVRRRLQTRKVGHCGTLDPMATGVLVVVVGEATKLVPYLTAEDKRYTARLRLGVATDSLDADGEQTDVQEVPELDLDALRSFASGFVGPHKQRAPRVSAIKVDGRRLHEMARKGEEFEAPERDVILHSVEVTAYEAPELALELHAAKGFYVRSFGRDLAAAAGTLGHLVELRRVSSGSFSLEQAVPLDETLDVSALHSLESALEHVMPLVSLDEQQYVDARHGRIVSGIDINGHVGLVREGNLVAIANSDAGSAKILRGFRTPEPA
ncbi:MAG: tRNA pseudouridine(55) synthase TruB [Polyangiales bacterium]